MEIEKNNAVAAPDLELSRFKKASSGMIATNDSAYNTYRRGTHSIEVSKEYTKGQVLQILDSGSLEEKQTLSRSYFNKDGVYKRLIIHYATLLTYAGMLIPNPAYGKDLSSPHISKRYYNALDFVEKIGLPDFFVNCATKAYTDGCYYGVITQLDKNTFTVLDLPSLYCVSNFKDCLGNDIIQFNVSYFSTIVNTDDREAALNAYPIIISSAYRKYIKGKLASPWVIIPSKDGVCFPSFNRLPPFLSVIPTTLEYKDSVEREAEKQEEEIKKIIVQKIPHNSSTNELLFEPDEAEVIHSGTVGMMRGEKNVRILTTYADVDAISSSTSSDRVSTTLQNMLNSIFLEAGASNQLFSATGSNSVDASNKNDLAFVMVLANKFSRFVTNAVNRLYSNGNIDFKYIILPVTWQNSSDYITDSFKLASSGYSWLMPAAAMGLSQRDLVNIKDLENNILSLKDKLIPLESSYTQAGEASKENVTGRPEKTTDEKSEGTIEKDKSLDKK